MSRHGNDGIKLNYLQELKLKRACNANLVMYAVLLCLVLAGGVEGHFILFVRTVNNEPYITILAKRAKGR